MNEQLLKEYQKIEKDFDLTRIKVESIVFDIAGQVDCLRDDLQIDHSYQKFEIGESTVQCQWEDFWSYVGNNSGTTTFPIELLLNPSKVSEYVDNLNRKKYKKEREHKEYIIKQLKNQLSILTN